MHVYKILSATDIGQSSTHQAGILVPKRGEVLGFFPALKRTIKNPRIEFRAIEKASGAEWRFVFIYYNNKFFGGTRNEFRLTHMTEFFRRTGAVIGDQLHFFSVDDRAFEVELRRSGLVKAANTTGLQLSTNWVVVSPRLRGVNG